MLGKLIGGGLKLFGAYKQRKAAKRASREMRAISQQAYKDALKIWS